MRYLITGGAGFIGSHLAESLIGNGHEVVVVDDLSTGSEENIKGLAANPGFDFVKGNILYMPGLEKLISDADTVFHLAAAVGVELVVHDPVRTITTNVHGTERVLEAAAKAGVKIVITSTSEVYGKSKKMTFSETDDLLIGPPCNSRWSYACSKLLDEFLMMAFFRSAKLPGVIVRLFNTVGPRQTGRYGMVLPRFVAKALAGEDLQIYGTGRQTRCFCHVKDTVRALVKLSESEAATGRVVNIGSTDCISINQLSELVIERLGSSSGTVYVPYEEAYEEGFEDMLHRIPDIREIRKLIGWEPRYSLEEIIDDVAEYQKSSPAASEGN